MTQSRIESFFQFIPEFKETSRKYFVYCPHITSPNAEFLYKPEPDDTYITTKLGVKLYYREPTNEFSLDDKPTEFPNMRTDANISLLKSNLQKAIRRKNAYNALHTALALIQRDPLAFLRRLAIIYIEDVCLTDSYPIVIWLMMAFDAPYNISNRDIDILLHIVCNLAECDTWYNNRKPITISKSMTQQTYTQTHLQEYENASLLLGIYYRTKYGGMKGDINMLLESIDYYAKNGVKIGAKTEYNVLDYAELYTEDSIKVEILKESIDFHPFPNILQQLANMTNGEYKEEEIKRTIWFAESGVNYRKPYTMEQSEQYRKQTCWQVIKRKLDIIRKQIIH